MEKVVKKNNVKRKVSEDKVKESKNSARKVSAKTNNKKTNIVKNTKTEEYNYDLNNFIPKKKSETPIIVVCLLVYLVVVIIPIIFVVFTMFMNLRMSDFEYVGNNIRVGLDEFMISDIKTEYIISDNNYVISGYIKDLNDDFNYVEIIFELYDSNNFVLGESSAVLYNLDDERKYKFNATYYDYDADEVAGYRLKEIYYY